MLWGKIKSYALIVVSGLLAVAYALFKSEQAARAREKLKASEAARETERKANQALNDGLQKEKEAKNAKVDVNSRTDFES